MVFWWKNLRLNFRITNPCLWRKWHTEHSNQFICSGGLCERELCLLKRRSLERTTELPTVPKMTLCGLRQGWTGKHPHRCWNPLPPTPQAWKNLESLTQLPWERAHRITTTPKRNSQTSESVLKAAVHCAKGRSWCRDPDAAAPGRGQKSGLKRS